MFTIRHMTPAGNEGLHEAQSVSFIPVESAPLGQPALTAQHQLGTLWLTPPDPSAPLFELRDGQVYVMNEAGSTVAKYDLGGWGAIASGGTTAPPNRDFLDPKYAGVVD